jgi:uncharacterized protein (TIGR02453 family)
MDYISSSVYMRSFLADLKANNNREWLYSQEKRYQQAKKYFLELTGFVLEKLQEVDPQLSGLEAKSCVFRQARDIRFSKDKTPYKTHFSFGIASGGKKGGLATYYFHFDPSEAFVGGGVYMPPTQVANLIRQEIDYQAEEFLSIVNATDFLNTYGELDEERIRSMPKGYEKSHPMAEYLKLKSFTASKILTQEELTSARLPDHLVSQLLCLVPLLHFINRALETTRE